MCHAEAGLGDLKKRKKSSLIISVRARKKLFLLFLQENILISS